MCDSIEHNNSMNIVNLQKLEILCSIGGKGRKPEQFIATE